MPKAKYMCIKSCIFACFLAQKMKLRRIIFIGLGVVCVLLGTAGTVVPGLPTTPFLLLASWLFYRSSPRLRNKLLSSWLGKYIRDYEKNKGLTWQKKVSIILLMAAMCTLSIVCFIDSLAVRIVVGVAGLIGGIVVGFVVPTLHSSNDT